MRSSSAHLNTADDGDFSPGARIDCQRVKGLEGSPSIQIELIRLIYFSCKILTPMSLIDDILLNLRR